MKTPTQFLGKYGEASLDIGYRTVETELLYVCNCMHAIAFGIPNFEKFQMDWRNGLLVVTHRKIG